jgi:hypothetical protein
MSVETPTIKGKAIAAILKLHELQYLYKNFVHTGDFLGII